MLNHLPNDEDIVQLLQKHVKCTGIEVVSSNLKPFSEHMIGFMGDHYLLVIKYKLDEKIFHKQFFIKTVPTKNKIQTDSLESLNPYGKEIFFYDILLNEYESRGYNTSFAPKCYFTKDQKTLVLEDLCEKQFHSAEKNNSFDLNQCERALEALAYFHGASILYEEDKSKELGRKYRLDEENCEVLKEVYYSPDHESVWYGYMITHCDFLELILELIPDHMVNKNLLINRFREFNKRECFNQQLPSRKTCSHGDLWINNILFNTKDGITKCVLVDYQYLRYFHPGFDVLLLIYFNTRRAFRMKHMDYLLNFYYDSLSSVLAERNVDINDVFPRTDYSISLDSFEYLVAFQASAIHAFVYLSKEIINDLFSQDYEKVQEARYNTVKLYYDYFNEDTFYRTIIEEDVYTLNEIVLKYSKNI